MNIKFSQVLIGILGLMGFIGHASHATTLRSQKTLPMVSVRVLAKMPDDFTYLRRVAPTIMQDIRYTGFHNFMGKPSVNYRAAECILTKQAAKKLLQVQGELEKSALSLKVYDCYRPHSAVEEFVVWSQNPRDQKMKKEFYPNIDKKAVFTLGYVAAPSSHSRGSTVDLTIVAKAAPPSVAYNSKVPLVACFAPVVQRFADNSMDMGTGYDCMDPRAYPASAAVSRQAHANRLLLQHLMKKYGFVPYDREWWHFTLAREPYPLTVFDFPII